MKEIKKVKKDGKVAVLYSPGFGAGWYSWNDTVQQCLFSPEIVELVLAGRHSEIDDELCEKLFEVDYFYSGGARDLEVQWIAEGTAFRIDEYDGSESVEIISDINFITA